MKESFPKHITYRGLDQYKLEIVEKGIKDTHYLRSLLCVVDLLQASSARARRNLTVESLESSLSKANWTGDRIRLGTLPNVGDVFLEKIRKSVPTPDANLPDFLGYSDLDPDQAESQAEANHIRTAKSNQGREVAYGDTMAGQLKAR